MTEALAIAQRFADEQIAPYAQQWEQDRSQPLSTLRAATQLTGLLVPTALGGQGLSKTELAKIAEVLAAADLGVAFALVVHNNLMNAVATLGSSHLQQTYLPKLANMEMLGAFLLTEAGAGSDAAAIETTAKQTTDGWVINGAKAWVTNAQHANLLSVYAQTNPGSGARGIAAFLVPADTPGVTRNAPYSLVGGHSMGTGSFDFAQCEVPSEALLAPPGKGFKAALSGIDLARAVVAAMSCGILGASLDLAITHCKTRQLFGSKLADKQGMQWQLADVATDLHAMQLMAYQACELLDAGAPATLAAAHAKKFATRQLLSGVAQCMQALGANGLRQDTPLARHYAAAKIAQYIDGTTEIQNVVLSRALFAD